MSRDLIQNSDGTVYSAKRFFMARNQLLATVFFCFGLLFAQTSFSIGKELPSLTVFVHGTIMPYLGLTSYAHVFHGEVPDDAMYAKVIKKARVNALMYEEHPMLEEGFIHISRQKINETRAGELKESRCAIYYLISAYDRVGNACGFLKPNHEYAAFGWSALNCPKSRKEAGERLRDHLADIAKNYKDITVLAYSAGGNAVLEMERAEKAKKRGLKIKLLVMFGTPIQTETAPAIMSQMFESIVAFRSLGDNAQQKDIFSTQTGESFRMMRDLVNLERVQRNPGLRRADVQFIVNDDPHVVDHFNMIMIGQSSPVHAILGPLPAAVLVPSLLQQLLPRRDMLNVEAHIKIDRKTVTTYVKPLDDRAWHQSGKASMNFYSIIDEQRTIVKKYWKKFFAEVAEHVSNAYDSVKKLLKKDKKEIL